MGWRKIQIVAGGLATYVGCLYATISCFPKFPLDDGGKHSEKRKPGGVREGKEKQKRG